MADALVPASGAALCGTCGKRLVCVVCGEDGDAIEEARKTVRSVMRGGGRNALAQLRAAELVLGKKLLDALSDDDLLAEVRRRSGQR